jgi:ribosomal protein S18 acetylase RimI-like enzyme
MQTKAKRPNLSDFTWRTSVKHSDLIGVGEIVRSSGYFSEEEIAIALELVEEGLLDGPASEYSFIFAELNDHLIGYSCFGLIPCTTVSYDIYWIAVQEDFRYLGIGNELLRRTEAQIAASGGKRIYVDTSGRTQYSTTRNFYQAKGYEVDALLNDFYGPGDDKIVYRKVLP